MNLETFISQVNSLAFFAEFAFSRNMFSPDPHRELELADNILWFGDFLTILQLKERNPGEVHDDDTERRWFKKKVIGDGTKQIRDSLRYLKEHPQIGITNERGHSFDLTSGSFREIIKLVVYLPGRILPNDCRRTKEHVSRTAGFIHILLASDYLEICRTLRVPADILDYFRFRQDVVERLGIAARDIAEPMMMGQYLSGDLETTPSMEPLSYLRNFIQDSNAFDISGLLSDLHKAIESNDRPYDYYRIMAEFARLPRSAWREIKTRFVLCIQKTRENKFARPYRLVYPHTGCGFVFIPVDSSIASEPNSQSLRINGLTNFTLAHKYDQKLNRCVGIMVAKEGRDFLIDWCLIEFPWTPDAEMEAQLAENFPFREVRGKALQRFLFKQ